MNLPAPLALRPARRSGGAAALAERLLAEGVRTAPSPLLPEALRVEAGAPQKTAAFKDGWFYIQDEASQIVALLLEPLAGARAVLDACAAPGGKLLGALDAAGPGETLWVAADASPERLRLVRDNARRLRLQGPRLVAMDAARPALRPGFDRILVDAPCSGTGVIRRHPEIRWRRTPSDFAAQAARQGDLLRAALDLAAPGGRTVYAVCSLEPEEGPRVVDDATRGRDDVRRVGVGGLLPPGLLRLACADGSLLTLPHRDDTDGFFAAVLQKRG
jgi:16S rRNA (cytosine967-C5)-methyltransferase